MKIVQNSFVINYGLVPYYVVTFDIIHGYIDPATTAMITQIVAGIVISIGVTCAIFRNRIVLFFRNINIKLTQKKVQKENRKDKSVWI